MKINVGHCVKSTRICTALLLLYTLLGKNKRTKSKEIHVVDINLLNVTSGVVEFNLQVIRQRYAQV
jgi:hypothetical protein